MNNNIIMSRDEYLDEIYSCGNENELNEGIFDYFKVLAKKEWKSIKSKDATILKKLEDADRSLNGFTLAKLKNAGACVSIRQALCDFANTLWEYKKNELESGKKGIKKILMSISAKGSASEDDKTEIKNFEDITDYMKKFDIKDKTLKDTLKNLEAKLSELCDGNGDLIKWSNMLKLEIRNIINGMIIDEYDASVDGEEKKEEVKELEKVIEQEEDEEDDLIETENNKEKKEQEDSVKEIENERKNVLKNLGVTLKDKVGDICKSAKDFIGSLAKKIGLKESDDVYQYSFKNIINESKNKQLNREFKSMLDSDEFFGFSNINSDIKDTVDKKIAVKLLKSVFDAIDEKSNQGKNFENVAPDAIQSMYVGLVAVVQYAITGEKMNDDVLNLLARCSISSDDTIGYGIPLVDDKKREEGNIFTAVIKLLVDNGVKVMGKVPNDHKDIPNKFKTNLDKIFKDITDKAEKLKKENEK